MVRCLPIEQVSKWVEAQNDTLEVEMSDQQNQLSRVMLQ